MEIYLREERKVAQRRERKKRNTITAILRDQETRRVGQLSRLKLDSSILEKVDFRDADLTSNFLLFV